MQVNSINNQNSFGLKFSPLAEATIRGAYRLQECAKKGGLVRKTESPENIQRMTKAVKRMFPHATLDIKTERGADPILSSEGFLRKFGGRCSISSQDYVNEIVVLKRQGMPDEKVIENPVYKRNPLKNILAALKRIQKKSQ